METIYVLFATFDDPEPIPPELWLCSSQAAAEEILRSWSVDFLGGFTHDVDDLPPDNELVAAFRAAGAHVHLFECQLDGMGGDELVLFERDLEHAHPMGTA